MAFADLMMSRSGGEGEKGRRREREMKFTSPLGR